MHTKSSQKKLLSIAKSMAQIARYSDAVYWLGAPDFNNCVYLNPSYETIWGYRRETLFKDIDIWATYLFPTDLADHHPLIEMTKRIKLYGPEARYNEMYRIVNPNGEMKYIEDRGQPIYDEEGEYIAVSGVAVDVTAKKLIEQFSIRLPRQFSKSNQRRFYLKNRYQKIYLTPCEAECAFYLLQGKTAKETAKILGYAHRTIEHMIERIKHKLDVHYKSELFDALLEGRFIETLEEKE